ncbi:MAG TPA: tetratricopeptide repeat protein [Bryobacteraceae bacterium]|nr:tetratricopeptide repeat protein [Bryobacteraceae bacterium]
MKTLQRLASFTALLALFTFGAMGQTASLEGEVKGEDGKPLKDALIKLERKDIKGSYKVKTNKKGQWFHAGLPLGNYDIMCEVDGKVVDSVKGVRTRLGDPLPVNFDLSKMAAQRQAMEQAASTGKVTEEMSREMSKEQKEALEKAAKERAAALAKNKELNDAFNAGMENLKAKNFPASLEAFDKAAAMDPKQVVIWANKAEAHVAFAGTKNGEEQVAELTKAFDSYNKALELKPDDASMHNNYALALAKAKKYPEAQAELDKAAQLDAPNAGKYYYNLGAILTNVGQLEPASVAFKKAIDADPNYADAHYQYGLYLFSKATITADGKTVPVAGTTEAFQKYLELKPEGPFAEAAKGMLAAVGAQVSTEYKNPNAPAGKKSTTKGKK